MEKLGSGKKSRIRNTEKKNLKLSVAGFVCVSADGWVGV